MGSGVPESNLFDSDLQSTLDSSNFIEQINWGTAEKWSYDKILLFTVQTHMSKCHFVREQGVEH